MQRLQEKWKSIQRRLNNHFGNSFIYGVFILFAIILLFLPFFENWRINTLMEDAGNRTTSAVTALASKQIGRSYAPLRDGTSGSYQFDGMSFLEIRDTASYKQVFLNLHKGFQNTDKGLCRYDKEGNPTYYISKIQLFIHNATATTAERKSIYRITYTLSIPQQLLWKDHIIILKNQVQRVEYLHKF